METLASRSRAAGNIAAAERYLRRALSTDPLQESSQRALMETLAESGNYAAALLAYRELRLLLHRELNAEPDPQTRAIFEQIRSQAREKAAGTTADRRPPARSVGGRRSAVRSGATHNLPLSLTSFIGREEQIAELHRLLDQHRLVTLTGAGGCGKTRLALQVATDRVEAFSDGVWFVELASLADSELVPQFVAAALDLREQPGRTLTATLVQALKPRDLLLLLDNCEHLVGACAELAAALLQACPGLRILATSREALGVAGEQLYRVPSLQQSESERLFVDRAVSVLPEWTLTAPDTPAVGAICERLDGIPLAIELAAAWAKMLPVEQAAARLDDRFRLLTRGSRTSPSRHQTLRALIDWSYALLSDGERAVLRRLSVFAGGWTLAAEAVCSGLLMDDCRLMLEKEPLPHSSISNQQSAISNGDVLGLLSRLVDKSLVIVDGGGGRRRRYRLLETVRQYARDRLVEAEGDESTRQRHRDWFLDLAERAEPELLGAEQRRWLDQLEEEHDNLRAALAWSSDRSRIEAGLRLGAALWRFWFVRGYISDGWQQMTRLLALSDPADPTAARARALRTAGVLARFRRDLETARSLLEEGLAIQRELGRHQETMETLFHLANTLHSLRDYEAARPLIEEGLAMRRETGETVIIAYLNTSLGDDAFHREEYDAAGCAYAESLRIKRQLGDRRGIGYSLSCLAQVARRQSNEGRAAALYHEGLALFREVGESHGSVICLRGLAGFAAVCGDYEPAARLYGAATALRMTAGVSVLPLDDADHQHRIARVREALGEAVFTSAWAEGEGMTLEVAVQEALDRGKSSLEPGSPNFPGRG